MAKVAPAITQSTSPANEAFAALATRVANTLAVLTNRKVDPAAMREALVIGLPADALEALVIAVTTSKPTRSAAFAAGFVEACRWPEPEPSDTQSTAFEIARRRYLSGRSNQPLDDAAIEAQLQNEGSRHHG